ncbi:MAG: hypothetical protein ACRDYE_07700 [Acidimicrobiales bacterium]
MISATTSGRRAMTGHGDGPALSSDALAGATVAAHNLALASVGYVGGDDSAAGAGLGGRRVALRLTRALAMLVAVAAAAAMVVPLTLYAAHAHGRAVSTRPAAPPPIGAVGLPAGRSAETDVPASARRGPAGRHAPAWGRRRTTRPHRRPRERAGAIRTAPQSARNSALSCTSSPRTILVRRCTRHPAGHRRGTLVAPAG